MIYTRLTKNALGIAYKAHKKQLDRSGVPYVFHPYEVASSMDDEITCAAALLHDVLEDTRLTERYLLKHSIPKEVVELVKILTRDPNEDYFDYIRRVKTNPAAVKIKLADLAHNGDSSRLDEVSDADRKRLEKYAAARAMLTE